MTGPDLHHFRAAQGWLELGDWREAEAELEQLSRPTRSQADVLKLRMEIYSAGQLWEKVMAVARVLTRMMPEEPLGHLRLAFALHELKRTQEALDALLPVSDRFPQLWVIPYNLACYTCQLGRLSEARDYLAQAIQIGGRKAIQPKALEDPDLAPLWTEDSGSP